MVEQTPEERRVGCSIHPRGTVKKIPEKTYLLLFKAGILFKAIISAGEIVVGTAFLFVSYDTLQRIGFSLFGEDLREIPRNVVWDFIAKEIHRFMQTSTSVWAFIFLSHGLVKIVLLAGLWKNKLWAYPASIVVFTFFVIYQFVQMYYAFSISLAIITILDIIVIGLTLHEYRLRLRLRKNLQK